MFSGAAYALPVDTTKGWHTLQQIAKTSADLTRADDNANGIIDSSENCYACNADAACEVSSISSSGIGTFANQVNIGGSWAQVQSTGSGTALELRTTGGGNILVTGGNVGIGTTGPVSKLQATGQNALTAGSSATNSLNIGNSGGNYAGIGYNIAFTTVSDTWNYRGADTASLIDFRNGGFRFYGTATVGSAGANAALSPFMAILNSGNVGIGTTSPSQKLDVAGNVRGTGLCIGSDCRTSWPSVGVTSVSGSGGITASPTTGAVGVSLTNPSLSCPGQAIQSFNMGTGSVTCAAVGSGLSGGGALNYIPKWTGSSSLGNSIIYDNGNVGIGTTSPSAKLEVVGGPIKATGGLIIETRTSDPASPVTGQIWLRTDL